MSPVSKRQWVWSQPLSAIWKQETVITNLSPTWTWQQEPPKKTSYWNVTLTTHPNVHHNRGWPFLDLKRVVKRSLSIAPTTVVIVQFRLTRYLTKSFFLGQLLTKICISKNKGFSQLNTSNMPLEVPPWQAGANRVLQFCSGTKWRQCTQQSCKIFKDANWYDIPDRYQIKL
jgi:hypothetical protein